MSDVVSDGEPVVWNIKTRQGSRVALDKVLNPMLATKLACWGLDCW